MGDIDKTPIDEVDGLQSSKERQSDDKKFEIAVEQTCLHDIATFLQDDVACFEKFIAFLNGLNIPPSDRFVIQKRFNGSKPPAYNAAHKLLETWISMTDTENVTYKHLLDALGKQKLLLAFQGVTELLENKYGKEEKTKTQSVQQEDAHELALSLSRDHRFQATFIKLMKGFQLGSSEEAMIQQEFEGKEFSAPFYNLVSEALETWFSTTEDRSWKALFGTINKAGIPSGEATLKEYFVTKFDKNVKPK